MPSRGSSRRLQRPGGVRGVGRALIPEPKGFSDPVKRQAARSERTWEAATGVFSSSAAAATAGVAVGVAIPAAAAPVLLALAGVGFYAKLRAKWAKEDPPRDDYERPVSQAWRSVTVEPLLGAEVPASLGALLVATVNAGDRLGATIEAVEKSMGAVLAQGRGDNAAAGHAANQRFQARDFARETGWALHGVAGLAREAILDVEAWSLPAEAVIAWGPGGLLGQFDKGVVGRVAAAGLWRELRQLDAAGYPLPEEDATLPGLALLECAVASTAFANALLRWASDDDGPYPVEPDPTGSSGSGPSPGEPEPEPAVEATFAVAGR